MSSLKARPETAALLIVDVQQKLLPAMPTAEVPGLMKNLGILVETARRLSVPVVLSEQYPAGLGGTATALEELLNGLAVHRFSKTSFSCIDVPEFRQIHERLGKTQWWVVGLETHICVYQTARDLLAFQQTRDGSPGQVHVPADATCSRTADRKAIGLDLMRQAGAVITSTETLAFDALGRAGTDDFKAIARLVR